MNAGPVWYLQEEGVMTKRHFTRVDYCVGASIKFGNMVVICNTVNVSLCGLYLKTDQKIAVDTPVNITVYLSSHASIKLSACVVRKDTDGICVQINSLDNNSFEHLRTIVAANSTGQENIMQDNYGKLECVS